MKLHTVFEMSVSPLVRNGERLKPLSWQFFFIRPQVSFGYNQRLCSLTVGCTNVTISENGRQD